MKGQIEIGTLFVVGTPIGNLGDFSPRAIDTLQTVDIIYCESPKELKKLGLKFGINTKYQSYLDKDLYQAALGIFTSLERGHKVALVSDAGMPGISDPGSALIRKLKNLNPKLKIESVPGPSALTSFISIAGLESRNFAFFGFPPVKKGRQKFFQEAIELIPKMAIIFYESPHRIIKTLQEIEKHCQELNITKPRITLAREITKIFESSYEGEISQVIQDLEGQFKGGIKGEIVFSLEQRQK